MKDVKKMTIYEQGEKQTGWSELLLNLDSLCSIERDEKTLMESHPIPDSWQSLVRGKRIIVFYLGSDFLSKSNDSASKQAQSFMNLLSSLGDATGNMKNAVLWWFDDGLIKALIDAIADENERIRLEQTYMWTKQLHLAKSIHDESKNFDRAMQWGNIYYGDNSAYKTNFQKAGKPIALYALRDNIQTLKSWMTGLFTKREIPILPIEWNECIKDRKVLLFSLWSSVLLTTGSLAITLLENLIYLTNERKDICIWWLVDKDLNKTVSLLFENLRQSFEEVRNKFKAIDNVIYDESDEQGRALEYADVCFGSPRNIKGRVAVKPTLQPPYYTLKILPKCPQVNAFSRDGEKIYFIYNVRNVFGALCEADLHTDEVKVLCRVPNNEKLKAWGVDYIPLVRAEDKLIMPPVFSNDAFGEYNIATRKLNLVPCEKKVWEPNIGRYGAFGAFVKWNDSVYFVGNINGLLVEYRIKEDRYIYHEHWLRDLGLGDDTAFGAAELVEDTWYLTVRNKPVLLTVDMNTLKANILDLPLPNGFQPGAVFRLANELWISPLKGNSLICMNINTKKTQIVKCSDVSTDQHFPFSSVVPWQQERLIFPYFADYVYRLKSGDEVAEPDFELTRKLVRPFEDVDTRNEVFWAMRGETGDSYLTFRERGTELIEFWSESGEVRYHKLKLRSDDEEMLKTLVYSWNLRNMLQPVTDELEREYKRKNETVSQYIWRTVRDA